MKFELDSVSAFFRNDLPDGIAVCWTFPDAALGQRFATDCEAALPFFDAHWPPELAIRWLTGIGKQPGAARALAPKVIMLVHWLERRGHIQSDEYNGVLWVSTQGDQVCGTRLDGVSLDRLHELRTKLPPGVQVQANPLSSEELEKHLRELLGTPPSN